jgi:hypothetical protein
MEDRCATVGGAARRSIGRNCRLHFQTLEISQKNFTARPPRLTARSL